MRLALKYIEVRTSVVDGTLIQIVLWHCPLEFRLFKLLKCSVCWKNKDYETSFNCQDVSLINGSLDARRQKLFLSVLTQKA